MKKLFIHLLSVLLILAPVGNLAYAFEDDEAMEMEDDLLGDESDDLFGDDAADEEPSFSLGFGGSGSGDETFPIAYEHIDDMEVYDPYNYRERRGEYGYYKSGTKLTNYFRVNENNEESTDETIGILFFIVALPGIFYNNFFGWWH